MSESSLKRYEWGRLVLRKLQDLSQDQWVVGIRVQSVASPFPGGTITKVEGLTIWVKWDDRDRLKKYTDPDLMLEHPKGGDWERDILCIWTLEGGIKRQSDHLEAMKVKVADAEDLYSYVNDLMDAAVEVMSSGDISDDDKRKTVKEISDRWKKAKCLAYPDLQNFIEECPFTY